MALEYMRASMDNARRSALKFADFKASNAVTLRLSVRGKTRSRYQRGIFCRRFVLIPARLLDRWAVTVPCQTAAPLIALFVVLFVCALHSIVRSPRTISR